MITGLGVTDEIEENPTQPKRSVVNPSRDPSFVRLSADLTFASVIESEVDIALLLRQMAYRDIVMGDGDLPTELKGGKMLVETGRLRMPAESATFLAFNILQACAVEGLYDLESFEKNMEQLRKLILENASDDDAG